MMLDEGLENIYARHQQVAEYVRRGVYVLGFELLADWVHASNTVTAVKISEGRQENIDSMGLATDLTPGDIVAGMRAGGIEIAGGQGKLAGQIFRIGHMGFVSTVDIRRTMRVLAEVVEAA